MPLIQPTPDSDFFNCFKKAKKTTDIELIINKKKLEIKNTELCSGLYQ